MQHILRDRLGIRVEYLIQVYDNRVDHYVVNLPGMVERV